MSFKTRNIFGILNTDCWNEQTRKMQNLRNKLTVKITVFSVNLYHGFASSFYKMLNNNSSFLSAKSKPFLGEKYSKIILSVCCCEGLRPPSI